MKSGMKNSMKSCKSTFLILACFIISVSAQAQTWPDTSKSYHLLLEPYLLTPAMSGTVGVGTASQYLYLHSGG